MDEVLRNSLKSWDKFPEKSFKKLLKEFQIFSKEFQEKNAKKTLKDFKKQSEEDFLEKLCGFNLKKTMKIILRILEETFGRFFGLISEETPGKLS